MKTNITFPTLIKGGEWKFTQNEDEKWEWSVVFQDGKITSLHPFEKRVEAVEDARKHGYGKTSIVK